MPAPWQGSRNRVRCCHPPPLGGARLGPCVYRTPRQRVVVLCISCALALTCGYDYDRRAAVQMLRVLCAARHSRPEPQPGERPRQLDGVDQPFNQRIPGACFRTASSLPARSVPRGVRALGGGIPFPHAPRASSRNDRPPTVPFTAATAAPTAARGAAHSASTQALRSSCPIAELRVHVAPCRGWCG